MTRQIASGVGTPPIALLEERIRQLETRVALLTHAVEALTRESHLREPRGPEQAEAGSRSDVRSGASAPRTRSTRRK